MTSFDEALAGLDARVPSRMEPDLERITALAHLLGDPQTTYPSVHITGTNGKTSVARMVTSLLAALGVQAGTYTSPHLQDVRERIRVAGRAISREEFARVFGEVDAIAALVDAERDDHVSYFELLTAMGYAWFAEHPVDVGVFEVGMGGTWDATNLIRGEVAVITTVDVDHAQFLGGTPGEIAEEKSGIIKPGASVVVGQQPDDAMATILRHVERQGAALLRAGEDVAVVERALAVGGQIVTLRTPSREHDELLIPLHGAHQADNAAVALGALHAFLGGLEEVDDEVIREGLAAVEVPGRLEVVNREPTVVLDGAHNPAGARRAASSLAESFAFRDLILVVGCLVDKDIAGILGAFRDVASHVVVTETPSARGATAEQLAEVAKEIWGTTSIVVERSGDVRDALEKATGIAGELDGVLVTGSLITVGAARDVYVPVED